MPNAAADLQPACSGLLSGAEIADFERLEPDVIRPAREGAGDVAEPIAGHRARCSSRLPQPGSEDLQTVAPDPDSCARPRARDAKGRFAPGWSGNPNGRPKGIPNRRRRPIELALGQARPGTLVALAERKPYLLLPLLRLVMTAPPPAVAPGERLGIDFSRMTDAAEIADALGRVLQSVCRGEIGPADGDRLVRRARKPLRAIRRALWRELAKLKAALRAREREARAGAKPGARASRPQRGQRAAEPNAVATRRLSLRGAQQRSNLDEEDSVGTGVLRGARNDSE